ncbi:hypothetical protein BNJ_00037 [Kaumoebavirus]|uniref:hypothetical protein n=1 Tax=Kaumoebavirus TaxID=1859492 RepID=UPI0009C1CD8D|nr:hypothetical protein BNJ_00037 [Kaumoebavirus]ARA71880.1 hypothetical protein BNJ_00037 [Kaumoebavirus]
MLATKNCHELLVPTLAGEVRPDNWCKADYGQEYISAQSWVGPGLSGCNVATSKYYCKKGQSLGSADACCQGKDLAWGYSCDDKYLNYGSGACDNILDPACTGASLFADPNCLIWQSERPDQAKNNIQAYCNTAAGIKDPNCRIWCQSNPTQCDVGATSYCQSNPSDAFCSCISSKVPGPNCFDVTCQSKNGYVTTAMKNEKCGSLTQCTQINQLSAQDRAKVDNVQFTQICGAPSTPTDTSGNQTNSNIPTTTNGDTTTGSNTGGTGTTTTPATSSSLVFFIIFVLIIAVVIFFIYRLRRPMTRTT